MIPTYRRPSDLDRCLAAVLRQTSLPRETIVVVRAGDGESSRVVREAMPAFRRLGLELTEVAIAVPGVVAAMNKGLSYCRTELVAITDDDAEPHPGWLAGIRRHFASDERIAGVGGRDVLPHGTRQDGRASVPVGKLTWYGKPIGNHHLGGGAARDVDFLKGVNCAYRRAELADIGFETALLGSGAQVHWEMALGLALRRKGFRLVYDPELTVDHHESVRHDEDKRQMAIHPVATVNLTHNETFAVLTHLRPVQRLVYAVWSLAVGTTASPGLVQAVRYLLRGRPDMLLRTAYSCKGRVKGAWTWIKSMKNGWNDAYGKAGASPGGEPQPLLSDQNHR